MSQQVRQDLDGFGFQRDRDAAGAELKSGLVEIDIAKAIPIPRLGFIGGAGIHDCLPSVLT